MVIEQYMQLYLVPLFTSLLLTQQLKDRDQEQGQEERVKDEEKKENVSLIGLSLIHI